MENPFFDFSTFTNPYYEAPRPRYYYHPAPRSGAVFSPGSTRSVPVLKPAELSPSQPKVVSIPVHFVGTEKLRAAAAVKIQKVLRGFLVGRAVRKVLNVAAEVAEVERRVERKETVEMVRREEKERLRLNEMLMGLLFRLDSIRGFDSGVRDCRKRVIRRVIALQERVDAIAAGDTVEEKVVGGTDSESSSRTEDRKDTIADRDMVEEEEEEEDRTDSGNCSRGEERVDAIAGGDIVEEVERTNSQNCSRRGEKVTASSLSDQPSADENQGEAVEGDAMNDTRADDLTDIAVNSAPLDQTNVMEEPALEDASPENATPAIEKSLEHPTEIEPCPVLCEKSCDCDESTVEPMGESLVSGTEAYWSSIEEDKEVEPERAGDGRENSVKDDKEMEDQQVSIVECANSDSNPRSTEENKCSDDFKGVMERMVDENVKLQRLVADLCEKNVLQNRLINSLSQRVEQLEKIMARKKKKRQATGTLEDLRKWGKKL